MKKSLLILIVLFNFVWVANAQILFEQSVATNIYPDDEPVISASFENPATEGNLLLAFLGARTGGSGHFTQTEGTTGWELLDDAISGGGRLHVYYKFATAEEIDSVSFTTTVNSQYLMILAEFSGVDSIVTQSVVKTLDVAGPIVEFEPIQALANHVVIAAFAARLGDFTEDNEPVWTDNFMEIEHRTANPASPVAGAVAYLTASEDGEVTTEVSWTSKQGDGEVTGGVLFLLAPVTDDTSVLEASKQTFEMFPVPASRELNLRNMNNAERVSIFNITGQEIAKYLVSGTEASIDVSNLATGLYIINVIERDGKRVSKKLIIE
jgi:hypothetical protein